LLNARSGSGRLAAEAAARSTATSWRVNVRITRSCAMPARRRARRDGHREIETSVAHGRPLVSLEGRPGQRDSHHHVATALPPPVTAPADGARWAGGLCYQPMPIASPRFQNVAISP
jgi:hypothetical protein